MPIANKVCELKGSLDINDDAQQMSRMRRKKTKSSEHFDAAIGLKFCRTILVKSQNQDDLFILVKTDAFVAP